MKVEVWQIWAGLVGSILSGGGITGFFGWLKSQSTDRRIAVDMVQSAARDLVRNALEAADGQIDRLSAEIENLRRRTVELEGEIDHLRTAHDACEQKTRTLQSEVDALQREIEKLMSGEVPDYHIVRRVGGKT